MRYTILSLVKISAKEISTIIFVKENLGFKYLWLSFQVF
jgi:hypothetical protein